MKYDKIAFCGFMGSGKTTVAKRLATITGMDYIDTDAYIEKKLGMTVSEIFDNFGEEAFRKAEYEAIKEISKLKNVVISTGGGTFENEKTSEIFLQSSVMIIYLQGEFNILYDRIKFSNNRPLLKQKSKSELEELYIKRCKIYEKIANVVQYSGGSPETICRQIKKYILG